MGGIMTAVTEPGPRIVTLDVVRGFAVMGILAMNIVAFAMPFQAYFNPFAYGMESVADYYSWLFNFIFIDGRMRGLFSFLFGASTLLVIERARAAGESPAQIHYMRMFWLALFGLAHFYFIWFGDILFLYAIAGLLLFFFRNVGIRALIIWGVSLLVIQMLVEGSPYFMYLGATAPNADPELVRSWQELDGEFTAPAGQALADKMAMFRGPWMGLVNDRLFESTWEPIGGLLFFIWETLAYMLFGMAALKSGFFKGEWAPARYRKYALVGLLIGLPGYALIAWWLSRVGISTENTFLYQFAGTVPFRPFVIVAYASLVILLARRGGALIERVGAAGRAAFTNYLGTSILMTTLFYGYGLGLYGTLSRIELWIVVVAMWTVMLLWSKPWLDRFRYGPFEWLWRSLARMRPQSMRKAAA
jgi:uncharacterized protein